MTLAKRCMISQPRYLPALTYLQRIHQCDIFIILDTVQHSRQDFEHRNRIADRDGSKWLSLPLDRSIGSRPAITELRLMNDDCLPQHREQILESYRHAEYFDPSALATLYSPVDTLEFVPLMIEMLNRSFQIIGNRSSDKQQWIRASELPVNYEKGPDYLVNLCKCVGASHYISGLNGSCYIQDQFAKAGLEVSYHQASSLFYRRGKLPSFPWLAWVDPLFHQGSHYLREKLNEPMVLLH